MDNLSNNLNVLATLPKPSTNGVGKKSSTQPFILSNTEEISMTEMRNNHIIPVFTSTNEPLISHIDFIQTVWDVAQKSFPGETLLNPTVRVSHPVKGRVPEARYKKAIELEPWEQTIFYERMMFVIEVATMHTDVSGNKLNLTIGGVKSYNNDNLYAKRPKGDQQFQLFIGFKNSVCCNLCVSTDGLKTELGVRSIEHLQFATEDLIKNYNFKNHLNEMKRLQEFMLAETEFAKVIGRSRMYKHLPDYTKQNISPILFGDTQMGSVVKEYYTDEHFSTDHSGNIDMWKFYNLLTGANKTTYIDQFLERSVNAGDLVQELIAHQNGARQSWYLS